MTSARARRRSRTSGPDRTPVRRMASVITRLADGGSERRLLDVLDALTDVDHLVVVGEGSSPAKVQALGERLEVRVLPSLVRSVDPRNDLRAAAELRALFRDRDVDAVFTHQSKAGLLGRVAARAAGIGRVYHSASMASFGPGYGRTESLVFQAAERATAPLVDRYFVVGSDLADRLAANGVPDRKLSIVRSSIELGPFRSASRRPPPERRAAFGLDPDAAVLCFVGSLDDRKGAEGFVDLIAEVRARLGGRPVQALIAGDGPHRATIEAQLAGDRVAAAATRLLGHTDQVPAVMAASDVLVLTSSAEGLPQVLVQAAASALPFASYDIDGAHELVAMGARGSVVALHDRRALVGATVDLLRPAAGSAWATLPDAVLDQWAPAFVRSRYRTELVGR